MIAIYVFFLAVTFGNSLDDWINQKSKLVKNSNYKISFDYILKDRMEINKDEDLKGLFAVLIKMCEGYN